MAQGINDSQFSVEAVDPADTTSRSFHIAIWAAGYESRSTWWIHSKYLPSKVQFWYRVEFEEHRDVLDAPASLAVGLGELVGGQAGHSGWDGHWYDAWSELVLRHRARSHDRLDIIADYSSMPRTVFGPLILACLQNPEAVATLSLVYTPGRYPKGMQGTKVLEGLRSMVGVEGICPSNLAPSYLIGLGFDGILSASVVEFFQIERYSCFYGNPGVSAPATKRVLECNAAILKRAQFVRKISATDCVRALRVIEHLASWYLPGPVILVPLGPKPHVLASVLAASKDQRIAFRFPESTVPARPIQVWPANPAEPSIVRLVIPEPLT